MRGSSISVITTYLMAVFVQGSLILSNIKRGTIELSVIRKTAKQLKRNTEILSVQVRLWYFNFQKLV